MRLGLVVALLAATGTPALAAGNMTGTSAGYTYFNKAGANLATHNADVQECRRLAGRLHQPLAPQPGTSVYVPAGTSPIAAGIGGAIGMAIALAIEQKMADNRGNPVNLEHCMVVKGWRVVALDEQEGKAVDALDNKAKAARLAEWVGADQPHGQIVRVYDNDAANGAEVFTAATKSGNSLSTDVAPKSGSKGPAAAFGAYTPLPPGFQPPRRAKSANPPKPLKDEALGGVPEGLGLIVINVDGDDEISVDLQRLGPSYGTPAYVDGRPAEVIAARPQKTYAKPGAGKGTTAVFAVPPGRWRVASISIAWIDLSLCLGGPAFDLTAGEAVYVGSFARGRLAPDMDLAPAKAAFPAMSTVPDRLLPANWINGAQGQCEGTYLYALEIPGQPFVETYRLGTHATDPSATLAPAVHVSAAAAGSLAPPATPASGTAPGSGPPGATATESSTTIATPSPAVAPTPAISPAAVTPAASTHPG